MALNGVYYGPKCVETAPPKLLDALGAKRALVVTGETLCNKIGVVARIEDILKKCNVYGATFSEVGEHTPEAGIENGVSRLREVDADILVSAARTNVQEIPDKDPGFLRHIAIPTTLSAVEYRHGAGYTNKQGDKVSVSYQLLAPAGIILDAELTLPTPE
ncbi:Dehydroquinate synthase-like protein [Rhizopogon salebrosus TDB-379]|nr:Dehydroquinate synthase-like protein [Rhizopogon salebrosus TDB-379]